MNSIYRLEESNKDEEKDLNIDNKACNTCAGHSVSNGVQNTQGAIAGEMSSLTALDKSSIYTETPTNSQGFPLIDPFFNPINIIKNLPGLEYIKYRDKMLNESLISKCLLQIGHLQFKRAYFEYMRKNISGSTLDELINNQTSQLLSAYPQLLKMQENSSKINERRNEIGLQGTDIFNLKSPMKNNNYEEANSPRPTSLNKLPKTPNFKIALTGSSEGKLEHLEHPKEDKSISGEQNGGESGAGSGDDSPKFQLNLLVQAIKRKQEDSPIKGPSIYIKSNKDSQPKTSTSDEIVSTKILLKISQLDEHKKSILLASNTIGFCKNKFCMYHGLEGRKDICIRYVKHSGETRKISLCRACAKAYDRKQFCKYCKQIYSLKNKNLILDGLLWIECDSCKKWVYILYIYIYIYRLTQIVNKNMGIQRF